MPILPRKQPSFEQVRIDGKALPQPFVSDLAESWKKTDDLRDFILSWFVDDEIPSGTQNGTNKTFGLKYVPFPQNSLRLYKNGFLLAFGADYSLAGLQITLQAAPASTDSLLAYYRRSGSAAAVATASTQSNSSGGSPSGTPGAINFADDETPTGTINGSNTAFTLANTPRPAASLIFVVSGAIQLPGTDFTFSAKTVTLTVAPVAGVDWLRAWYRY